MNNEKRAYIMQSCEHRQKCGDPARLYTMLECQVVHPNTLQRCGPHFFTSIFS
eukprot:SAG31_NODE_28546_length_408_cov_1.090615_1_plen_52_part_01